MARSARLILPGKPHHIYQQGHNRQRIFVDEADYISFLDWLKEAAQQYRIDIHAYSLLENSLHLLATPSDETGLARMMQWIGRHYVPYFNKKYERSGTLWEGRFKTSVVEESWVMRCSRFVEMRPVTCGLANHAEDYTWSSYPHHAGIRPGSVIRDHAVYWNLGNTPFARELAYKEFFRQSGMQENAEMEKTLMKGWPLGSGTFIKQLEAATHRQFRMGKKGRPSRK